MLSFQHVSAAATFLYMISSEVLNFDISFERVTLYNNGVVVVGAFSFDVNVVWEWGTVR